jgi:hypothetical protein
MPALKGAFVNLGAGRPGAPPDVVVFQFNPEKVTRTPTRAQPPPRAGGAGPRRADLQPDQPPETISFSLKVDATDQLADGDQVAIENGILPMLAALELLMLPKSSPSPDLFGPAGAKKPRRHPPERLPTVLFFWGRFRVFPVAVTSLSVTETEYDAQLTPIRADVSVNLQVLTPDQLAGQDMARGAYAYSQGVKQDMAGRNRDNAAQFRVNTALSFSI